MHRSRNSDVYFWCLNYIFIIILDDSFDSSISIVESRHTHKRTHYGKCKLDNNNNNNNTNSGKMISI